MNIMIEWLNREGEVEAKWFVLFEVWNLYGRVTNTLGSLFDVRLCCLQYFIHIGFFQCPRMFFRVAKLQNKHHIHNFF